MWTDFTITIDDVYKQCPDVQSSFGTNTQRVQETLEVAQTDIEENLKSLVRVKFESRSLVIPDDLPGGDGTELDEILSDAYPQIRKQMAHQTAMLLFGTDGNQDSYDYHYDEFNKINTEGIIRNVDTNDDDESDAADQGDFYDLMDRSQI